MKIVFVFTMLLSTSVLAADLPDPNLTPGEANPELTQEVLCAKGFTTKNYRNVSSATKGEVYRLYHAKNHEGVCAGREGCEVDHLISLELGGQNNTKNLWPQSYQGEWSAHVKDKLENKLHHLVCQGKVSLKDAQEAISKDWIAAYKKYVQ